MKLAHLFRPPRPSEQKSRAKPQFSPTQDSFQLTLATNVTDTVMWLHHHNATWRPANPLTVHDGLYIDQRCQCGLGTVHVRFGQWLHWDGHRVVARDSNPEETKEPDPAGEDRMLKFGTGHIVGAQTTEGDRQQKTARFSDAEWDALIAEGEPETEPQETDKEA